MIKGSVTYRRPRGLSRRHLRADIKEALREVGREWHHQTLPRHFVDGASSRYRMRPRSAAHQERKLHRFGHQRPLVFSGAMAAELKRIAEIKPTSKGVRVKMRGPKYLYRYRKDSKQPDKAKEVTATTKAEERTIAQSLHAKLKTRMNKTAETERHRI